MSTDHGGDVGGNVNEPGTQAEETVTEYHRSLVSRRQFFSKLSIALSAVFGAVVGLPVVGFLVAPLLKRSPGAWQDIGAVESFDIGETVLVDFLDPSPLPWAGVAARSAAWLRRESELEFVAFAVNCTHLGCPIRWVPDGQIFMCPCHGGAFYREGEVAAGPPPRPLYRYPVRINSGQVELLAGTLPLAGE